MVTMSQKEFRRVKVIENAAAETPLSVIGMAREVNHVGADSGN
jgi:hypothetical protein